VWAPRARVVYAVSPLARSDVKSQNLPSACVDGLGWVDLAGKEGAYTGFRG
jgi:hypothetical protein